MKKFALYFHGCEVTTHRRLLATEGVKHVGMNFLYLQAKSPWIVSEKFSPTQDVLLDSGAATISKKGWDQQAHEEYMSRYVEFMDRNLDALRFVVETDFTDLSYDWIESQRRHIWDYSIPAEKFIPVWHEKWGDQALREMIERYPHIGVPPLPIALQNRLAGLVRSSGVQLHGLCYNHPYDVPNGLYTSILSTSWISPAKYGETVIWDHNRLRRYDNKQKDQARKRHRHQIIEAGFNPDLFDVPRSNELSRYTVWAWQQMENSMQPPKRIKLIGKTAPPVNHQQPIATNGSTAPPGEMRIRDQGQIDHDVAEVLANVSTRNGHSNGSSPYLPARREDLRVMPGFGFRTAVTKMKSGIEGEPDIEVKQELPTLTDASCRQCDSCSLSKRCSEFKTGASCAFMFPVQIRTKDQLMGTMTTFLEMQAQRVAFGKMAEDLNGGYPDPNLSIEIDRLYKIIYGMKKITEDTSLFKLNIEAQGAAAGPGGILSRLFGQASTEPLRRVDPIVAEAAVRDAVD